MDKTNDIQFIPYRLNYIGNKNTMRNIIIKNNEFLSNIAIVSIIGVTSDEK